MTKLIRTPTPKFQTVSVLSSGGCFSSSGCHKHLVSLPQGGKCTYPSFAESGPLQSIQLVQQQAEVSADKGFLIPFLCTHAYFYGIGWLAGSSHPAWDPWASMLGSAEGVPASAWYWFQKTRASTGNSYQAWPLQLSSSGI